jgi:hypothetical protein
VATGSNRADFVFLDRTMLEKRHPGVPLAGVPEEGAISIVLDVADAGAAAKAVGALASVATPTCVKVAPKDANGVILVLEAAG